ncbi:MAG TPA: LysE family translocator [Kineosporiaceae bacterium]|nr:LysE family translocator [Kineosporiaceae bacterium]
MTWFAGLWSFVVVVGLLTVTPGLDTALIVRTAVAGSPRQAWGVVLGIQSGTLAWGVLASAGVTALLAASHLAFEILRWVGAGYLIWMGLSLLWASRHPGPETGPETETARPDDGATIGTFFAGWRRGALTNLLNPKMGVFYAALLPQFIPASATPLIFGSLLAGVHVVLGTMWSTVLVVSARRLRRVLQRPTARKGLDRVTGTVITGFGFRLLFSR